MRPVPEISAHQFGVFTTRQAAAAGWSDSALAWAVRRQRLNRLVPGAYVLSDALAGTQVQYRRRRLAIRAAAAQLTIPGCVVSHATAALMAELPLLRVPERPCVTVRPHFTGDAAWAHLHRASLRSVGHVLRMPDRLPRTTSARTVVDLARECGIDEATVVGDAALRRRFTTTAELERVLGSCANWPGIRRAREAVSRLDALAESPLESISRLRILESHLPRPRLQANIFDSAGHWIARTDFLWDAAGVVGEADGLEKYDDVASRPLRREKLRQELLERTGLIVVRWDWSDVSAPARLIARITSALGRGQRRPAFERGWCAAA
jgi:Transcriptional regulator, AbiEi antitoxin